jgi:hypothetical protein
MLKRKGLLLPSSHRSPFSPFIPHRVRLIPSSTATDMNDLDLDAVWTELRRALDTSSDSMLARSLIDGVKLQQIGSAARPDDDPRSQMAAALLLLLHEVLFSLSILTGPDSNLAALAAAQAQAVEDRLRTLLDTVEDPPGSGFDLTEDSDTAGNA